MIIAQVLGRYSVTKLLGHFNAGLFFYPIAEVSLLGNFIALFFIFVTQGLGSYSVTKLLGHFNTGLFYSTPPLG